MNTKPNYKYHISGLKGIACIMIVIGHYLGIYKYADTFSPRIHVLDTILDSPVHFLLGEKLWLYLFFIASGYLVAKSSLSNIKELTVKCVSRFFRLAIPIFFTYIFVYVIYICIGFHASNTSTVLACSWFQQYYNQEFSVLTILKGPFDVLLFGESHFNHPYWPLCGMFIASLIIYCLKYIKERFIKNKYTMIYYYGLTLLIIISMWFIEVIPACLIGMLLAYYEDERKEITLLTIFGVIITLNMLLVLNTEWLLPEQITYAIGWGFNLIIISTSKGLIKILSNKVLLFLERLSWWVYSFHWPLLCSLGALMLIINADSLGLIQSYMVSIITCTIVTLITSIIMLYTVQKLIDYLYNKVTILINSVINKVN